MTSNEPLLQHSANIRSLLIETLIVGSNSNKYLANLTSFPVHD